MSSVATYSLNIGYYIQVPGLRLEIYHHGPFLINTKDMRPFILLVVVLPTQFLVSSASIRLGRFCQTEFVSRHIISCSRELWARLLSSSPPRSQSQSNPASHPPPLFSSQSLTLVLGHLKRGPIVFVAILITSLQLRVLQGIIHTA